MPNWTLVPGLSAANRAKLPEEINPEVTTKTLGYHPSLDGIRGIAILLVIGIHLANWPPGGYFGVQIFFVLSGFLITTILLEQHGSQGRISLRKFYLRRCRRLFPALVVALAGYLLLNVVRLATSSSLGWDELKPRLVAVAVGITYCKDLTLAFGHHHHADALNPLWSLGVEEQFYIVWPLLLILLLRSRRSLVFWLVLILGLAVVNRSRLALDGDSWWRLYTGPDANAVSVIAGCLAASLHLAGVRLHSRVSNVLMATSLVLLIVFCGFNSLYSHLLISVPVVAAASVCLILAAVRTGPLARALAFRPLVFTGRISYSLYLWHLIIAYGTPLRLLPTIVLCFVVAWLSYKFVEQPFLRRKPQVAAVDQPASPAAALAPSA